MKTATRVPASNRSKPAAGPVHRRPAVQARVKPDAQTARFLKAVKGLKGIL